MRSGDLVTSQNNYKMLINQNVVRKYNKDFTYFVELI